MAADLALCTRRPTARRQGGGKFVNQEIAEKLHVEVLGGWFDLGFNNWFSTRKPLNSLADLRT